MAYVNKLFDTNFIEYASYVIKDRAIPHVDDGMKPVQRRIIHSLFEMEDGKFHKVANVVGHCMKYHPHGDASINSALVVLANKDLFIDKQGNFGNDLTGDQASAARYIECRLLPLAKKVLYNPELTEFDDSYDGRNKEPVTFPAKIPVVLIQGAEGIAVGMSTRILPHNFNEVLQAVKASLSGKTFELFPDFPSGGLVDVSGYEDGLGKVLVRAKLDTSDPKRIIIRELPFGSTTESLISSIENAAKRGKIKISSISDFTSENVEIEIKLARGEYSQDTVDALYAFTDCETAISVNLLVIKDGKPVIMTVTEIIDYHAKGLTEILRKELKLEEGKLKDRLHMRTLEQIFIEERIYKRIETMRTQETVIKAVIDGFKPFASQIKREVTEEDVERLLKIPIRRISLYDINKAKKEMEEIKARLKEIKSHLASIVKYALDFLDGVMTDYGKPFVRRSVIGSFDKTDVREVVDRDIPLRYDAAKGFLGTGITESAKTLFKVSPYDRLLIIQNDGTYYVTDVPEKQFVDKGLCACLLADKEILKKTIFSIVYKDNKNKYPYIKRCRIEKYMLNKRYSLLPENTRFLDMTTRTDMELRVKYVPKPRLKILEETFDVKDFLVKGARAAGVRLAPRQVKSVRFSKIKKKPAKKTSPKGGTGTSKK
jgi:topoisomerase IV subunit A